MVADRSDPSGSFSLTLDRGLRLLDLLARPENAAGMTVTALAASLGMSRTAAYRLLGTLESHGYVVRLPGGRVRLGYAVTRLAAAVAPLVRAAATPVLRRLADELGATAHLTLVDGDGALAVVVVEPTWTDVHVAYRPGTRHGLDRGAAGRAIVRGREGGEGWVTSRQRAAARRARRRRPVAGGRGRGVGRGGRPERARRGPGRPGRRRRRA